MSQRSSDVPEQVRKFAPKDRPREHPTEEAGRALIAMLQQANELTNEARDRAAGYASKLGTELRAVEDHITELEAAISYHRERARIAEEWLQRIQREIEDKLIAPQAGSRAELPGSALIGDRGSGSGLPNALRATARPVAKGKEAEKSERKPGPTTKLLTYRD
jgi:hypothetical protein